MSRMGGVIKAMVKATNGGTACVPVSDVRGSKAAADRLRALDRERQEELRKDLIEAAAARVKAGLVPKRRVVKTTLGAVQPRPVRTESPTIPSRDTGGFAGVKPPLLTEAERKARQVIDKGTVVLRKRSKKRKGQRRTRRGAMISLTRI